MRLRAVSCQAHFVAVRRKGDCCAPLACAWTCLGACASHLLITPHPTPPPTHTPTQPTPPQPPPYIHINATCPATCPPDRGLLYLRRRAGPADGATPGDAAAQRAGAAGGAAFRLHCVLPLPRAGGAAGGGPQGWGGLEDGVRWGQESAWGGGGLQKAARMRCVLHAPRMHCTGMLGST